MQQSVIQMRAVHFNSVRKHEIAKELTGCDAPVQEDAVLIVRLLPANDELIVLKLYRQILFRETGDGESNSELIVASLFDVVGRVALRLHL